MQLILYERSQNLRRSEMGDDLHDAKVGINCLEVFLDRFVREDLENFVEILTGITYTRVFMSTKAALTVQLDPLQYRI